MTTHSLDPGVRLRYQNIDFTVRVVMSKEIFDLVRLCAAQAQPRVLCSVTQAERGNHVALQRWLQNNVHTNLDGIADGTSVTHWPTVAFMSVGCTLAF